MDQHASHLPGILAHERSSAIPKVEDTGRLDEGYRPAVCSRATFSDTAHSSRRDGGVQRKAHLQDILDSGIPNGDHLGPLGWEVLRQDERVNARRLDADSRQIQIGVNRDHLRRAIHKLIADIQVQALTVFNDMGIRHQEAIGIHKKSAAERDAMGGFMHGNDENSRSLGVAEHVTSLACQGHSR